MAAPIHVQGTTPLGHESACTLLRATADESKMADKQKALAKHQVKDTLPEWSKGVDSSSTSASCVGSNPTAVIFQILHASLGKALQYNETTGISEII